MLNRRRFLRYTLFGSGALALGFTGYTAITGMRKAIIDILTADLEGLKVNSADIEAYATAVAKDNLLYYTDRTIKMICVYTANPFRDLPLPFKKDYNLARENIVANFLLSTNFFTNRMDESLEISYSGIVYGPYRSPCVNPFSGLYYQG